jgi:hypothetical protein
MYLFSFCLMHMLIVLTFATVYDSSNAHGPAMRIPSTRGVHQGCVLGAMFFATVASRVYKQLAAIAPNESVVCGYFDDGHFM